MPARKKIGELLVEAGAVSEQDVREALGHQKSWGAGRKLGDMLIATRNVTYKAVARALAQQFDLPFVELPEIPPEVAGAVPLELQEKHKVVPFRLEVEGKSERLHVAVVDPANVAALDELRFNVQKNIRVFVAAKDDLERALALLRGDREEPAQEAILLDDADAELQVERNATNMVVGSWFGTAEPPSATPAIAKPVITPATPAQGVSVGARQGPGQAAEPVPLLTPPRGIPLDAKAAAEALDDLLGGLVGTPPVPASPRPVVPVLKFAAKEAPKKPEDPKKPEPPQFSEQDLQVLDKLERIADGTPVAPAEGEKVRPERMIASLIRLLIRKGIIHELEFLEELARK